MSIQAIAKHFFDDYIQATFAQKADVLRYLMTHERRDLCINEITQQLRLAELGNLRKRLDLPRIRQMAEAGAKMFCRVALQHAEEKAMSGAEKQRRIDSHERLGQLEAELIDKDIIKKKVN